MDKPSIGHNSLENLTKLFSRFGWHKKLKEPLDIHDVYRAMIGIKQIRNSQNPKVDDNMIDIIGYAALAIEAKDGKNTG